MEYIKKNLNIGLALIILLASVIRLVGLGNVPYGFANDEVSYILSGHTIAQTGGFDIAGKFLPLSVNLDSSLSPVPVYLVTLFTGLLGLFPFTARLPFALLGIGTIILVYCISLELFRKRGIAYSSALIMSLSSWQIIVTRSVWDVIPAQFFYLLGLYIFMKKMKKGNILWSLPAFLLGFFSYHGTKVFFAAFIVFLVILFWNHIAKRRKEIVLFIFGITFIFAFFALILQTQTVTRQQEIIFTNKGVADDAAKKIEFERGKSSAPTLLKTMESNKATYYFEKMVTNYLGAFSTQHLFTTGDIHPIVGYGVFFKGVLYLIDIPLILLALIYLIEKCGFLIHRSRDENDIGVDYRRSFLLVVGGLLISPFPSTFGAGISYVIRGFMMVPFLSIIVGIGLYVFWNLFNKNSKFKIISRVLIIIIYTIFVSRFLYQYIFQFNTYGSEYWNQSSRELSEYIVNNYQKYNRILVATSEDKVFFQYAMVSHAGPYELQVAWQKNWPVKFGKVSFINSCYKDQEIKQKISAGTLYVVHSDCNPNLKPQKTIIDPMEPLRVIWKLYEF